MPGDAGAARGCRRRGSACALVIHERVDGDRLSDVSSPVPSRGRWGDIALLYWCVLAGLRSGMVIVWCCR